jgi:hypothetical protein
VWKVVVAAAVSDGKMAVSGVTVPPSDRAERSGTDS